MKYFFALLIAILPIIALAQEMILVPPIRVNTQNTFIIEQVDDLRSVKKSIGQIQKGMLNKQFPAVFETDFDVFLKKYLNSAMHNPGGIPIYIEVKEFWISEETSFAKEVGRLKAEFDVYQKVGGGMRKIASEKYIEDFYAMDVTKGHGDNISFVLKKLLIKIDLSLMPADSQSVVVPDSLRETDEENDPPLDLYEKAPQRFPAHYNESDYGGLLSLGVALGGGGIAGIPLRFYVTPKFAIETGGYFRPFFLSDYGYISFYPGFMLAGGFVIYVREKMQRTATARYDGLSLKGGHSFSEFPESFGSLGWAMEKIQPKGSSFSAEIGIGVLKLHADSWVQYPLTNSQIQPLFYFKFQWAWYLVQRKVSDTR